MKLLLDANVSWRLSSKLKSHFNCSHVDHVGLKIRASDENLDIGLLEIF